MSTSIMIHRVTSVQTEGAVPTYSNANSVTLKIATADSGDFSITVFDLPTVAAEHLARAIARGSRSFNEDEVRADERAKVMARLFALIGEPA